MKNPATSQDIDFLLSPRAIRERAARIHSLAEKGGTHFKLHPERLDEISDFVLQITRENYPDLKIPFHSRWGHFGVGGVDRVAKLHARLGNASPADRARAKLDLAVVSVLLDAGSGPDWKYLEGGPDAGREFSRSEGLAVASFHLFMDGAFSSDSSRPLQADAKGLRALSEGRLASGFQVTTRNPLMGLGGRLELLHSLAGALEAGTASNQTRYFSGARPGGLLDWALSKGGAISAEELLGAVLRGLGSIWPGRISLNGIPLGDVWPHSGLGERGSVESLVPFHKLSQWLTYSLIEPLSEAGVRISAVDGLTGLAEYRNGGLILDQGLIELREPALTQRPHPPSSELVIEWRALTIHFLDRIADRVRTKLGRTSAEFPLARVLEGGTWWAGRKSAAAKRAGGEPPLLIDSDGTVF